ncbi:glycosyltransferase [Patulibacter minatonensis]|uniref:glycosyltransferase n=1 Tax=Patulibacter minatonensis TaxID=298163 RepID=UPI0004BCB592|nr:glycosyltransferase [Patulibacter minatonensis]
MTSAAARDAGGPRDPGAPSSTPRAAGLDVPVALSAGTRRSGGGRVLAGGMPRRILRLSAAGATTLDALLEGWPVGPAGAGLARSLVDAGALDPVPVAGAPRPAVTVVIPVRDRAEELDRCLTALGTADPVVVVDDGSTDPAWLAAVAGAHGARLLRRDENGGPAAARNDGLRLVETPVVAFLDSDCVVPTGWLDALGGHFADPLVAAVAPRVASAGGGDAGGRTGPVAAHRGAASDDVDVAHPPSGLESTGRGAPPSAVRTLTGGRRPTRTTLARFTAVRSPLDLGPRAASVRPGGPVPYVPTAALLVRRDALGAGFDPALRFGEDVDLVWRLHDAGRRIRYDPRVVVRHAEPGSWRALLHRRYRYGTSAAPLAARHEGRLTPLVLRPWPTAAVALALAGRPRAAGVVALAQTVVLGRTVRAAGGPAAIAVPWGGEALLMTAEASGRAAIQLAGPALAAGLLRRRTRRAAATLVLAASARGAWRARAHIDPIRWTLASAADEAAYGLGVWRGAWRHRTWAPVRPSTRSPGDAARTARGSRREP